MTKKIWFKNFYLITNYSKIFISYQEVDPKIFFSFLKISKELKPIEPVEPKTDTVFFILKENI